MVSNPEKELRFTRSQQARNFALLGAILMGIVFTFLATAIFGINPPVELWHTIPPSLLAGGAFWLAHYCNRHAFLILSPVGIEFFPLIKPSKNFQLWQWQEFHLAEIRDRNLYLHFDSEKTAGAVVSLTPLAPHALALLTTAIEGRMSERKPKN